MSIVEDSINNIIASQEVGTTIKLQNKALFRTKIASDMKYNGQVVDVIGFKKGKDIYNDRYIVKFNDGMINDNIMPIELKFNYEKIKHKKQKEQVR